MSKVFVLGVLFYRKTTPKPSQNTLLSKLRPVGLCPTYPESLLGQEICFANQASPAAFIFAVP